MAKVNLNIKIGDMRMQLVIQYQLIQIHFKTIKLATTYLVLI